VNVLVCGVGGQGVILFSNLLADVALAAGFDVKKSEVHGMAQRGGSVNTHVRYGERVYSPLIEEGTADLVVAFEMLEAVRYVHFLCPGGWVLHDHYRLDPLPVQIGAVPSPEDAWLAERLAARAPRRLSIDAFLAARELGDSRVQNVVMLGAASRFLDLPTEEYRAAIGRLVRPGLVELNHRAFERGRQLVGAVKPGPA